jgi:hypothetical protein
MVNAPSPEQVRRFLQCFNILSRFDAEQRLVRGLSGPTRRTLTSLQSRRGLMD